MFTGTPQAKAVQSLGDVLILYLQPASSFFIYLFFPPCLLSVSSSFPHHSTL